MFGGEHETRWSPSEISQHVLTLPRPSFLPLAFPLTTALSSPTSCSHLWLQASWILWSLQFSCYQKYFTFVHFPTIKTQLPLSEVASSVQWLLQKYIMLITCQSLHRGTKHRTWHKVGQNTEQGTFSYTMVRKHNIRDMHRASWEHLTQPRFRVGHMQETSSLLLSWEVQRGCWWHCDKCQGSRRQYYMTKSLGL